MLIVTYLIEGDDEPKALTEAEFRQRGLPEDWAEYVWQDQPDVETALARHYEAHDLWHADPSREVY